MKDILFLVLIGALLIMAAVSSAGNQYNTANYSYMASYSWAKCDKSGHYQVKTTEHVSKQQKSCYSVKWKNGNGEDVSTGCGAYAQMPEIYSAVIMNNCQLNQECSVSISTETSAPFQLRTLWEQGTGCTTNRSYKAISDSGPLSFVAVGPCTPQPPCK